MTKPNSIDPVVALTQELKAIEHRQTVVLHAIDRIEMQREHGKERPRRPAIEVGSFYCLSASEIQRSAQKNRLEPTPYLAKFRELEKPYRAWRKSIGLDVLDREERDLHKRWERTMRAISKTPAATFDGLAAKLALLHEGLTAGKSGYDEAIALSSLADLRRLSAMDVARERNAA